MARSAPAQTRKRGKSRTPSPRARTTGASRSLSGTFSTGFTLGLLAKDVGIAAELARQIGAEAPMSRLVCDWWSEARDAIGGEQDHTRAAIYWEGRGLRPAAE